MSRDVPEGWRAGKFDTFITLQRGFDLPVQDRRRGTFAVIASNGQIDSHAEPRIPGPAVVTGRSGTLGKVFHISEGCWPLNTTLYVKDFHGNDPEFVTWFLKQFKLDRFGTGTGVPTLNRNVVHEVEVAFPPLPEQRRIAEILSSVDEAIAATRAVIEQTRKVKQGVLERLLTKGIGHTRFKQTEIGEIPEGWGLCALGEVAKIKHGYAFSGEFFSKEEGPNILLTPGNFSKEKTLYFGSNTKFYQGPIPSDFILKNGDLLVVMTDLTPSMDILGNAVILNSHKAVLHNQRIGKVEVNSNLLSDSFLRHVLNSERVQRQIKKSASGTTVRHTSPSRILENMTALPPMEEQLSIVEALRTIDDALYLQIQSLERISSLKSALMSDLLTGRKRVTDALPLAAE